MIHRLELSVTAKWQQRFRSSSREGRGSRREDRVDPRTHFQLQNSSEKTRVVQGGQSERTGSLSLCEDASPTHERPYRRARYPRTTHTENRVHHTRKEAGDSALRSDRAALVSETKRQAERLRRTYESERLLIKIRNRLLTISSEEVFC